MAYVLSGVAVGVVTVIMIAVVFDIVVATSHYSCCSYTIASFAIVAGVVVMFDDV